jgi:glycosyltransferase involved in cell wall biosynthesis
MKKICIISPSAYPLFNKKCDAVHGGAEVDSYLLAKEISQDENFEISFIVKNFGQAKRETFDRVKVYSVYKNYKHKIYSILNLIFRMKEINADYYFQESASGGTGIIALFCKLFNKKFIYRIASDNDCNKEFVKKKKIEGLLFLYGIKNAAIIISQNENQKKDLKKNYGLNSIVIKNATFLEKSKIFKKDSILWVGRGVELKRPFLFLEIARKIKNHKFVMICPMGNSSTLNYERLKEEANKIKNLNFIESVKFEKIEDYFARAKLFISTSDYEGFPNTFVQSAKNKVPIISLNVDPDEFISKNECGVFVKGNFKNMLKAVKSLSEDERELKALGRNALNYVKRNHDIKKIIKQYKIILKK